MMSVQEINDQVILNYLAELGHNPKDFRIVDIRTYNDGLNSRLFDYLGVRKHVVPAKIAEKVFMIGYDFSRTNIKVYSGDKKVLGSTSGLEYSDIEAPTAFAVDDLYVHLGIKKLVGDKLVLVRSPVREYAK
jgi:hypothetical protein